MNKWLVLFFAGIAGFSGATTLVAPCTELDKSLFCLPGMSQKEILEAYMRSNNLAESEMVALLERNYLENITNAESAATDRFQSARKSVAMLWFLPSDGATRALEKYAGEGYHEEIRRTAVGSVIHKTGLAALPFVSNVMTQAWRTSNEHDEIRRRCFGQAKSASPEDRDRYLEFLKWAVVYDNSGGFKTWDRALIELDPSWRADSRRRLAADAQWRNHTTEYGTNLILSIIHDYELAAGIRKPDQPPGDPVVSAPPPPAPEPPPSATNTPREAERAAPIPESAPEVPAPRSWKPAIALGAVLLAVSMAVGVRRRKSKAKSR